MKRKRVTALRRAPDGSAFQKCESCGVSVAVALVDMHSCYCDDKREVKRFRALPRQPQPNLTNCSFDNEPRSPYLFFLESFRKTCEGETLVEIDRKACEIWRKMSPEEQRPYKLESARVDKNYAKTLIEESIRVPYEEDEVDSAVVGRCLPPECYSDFSDMWGDYDSYASD